MFSSAQRLSRGSSNQLSFSVAAHMALKDGGEVWEVSKVSMGPSASIRLSSSVLWILTRKLKDLSTVVYVTKIYHKFTKYEL